MKTFYSGMILMLLSYYATAQVQDSTIIRRLDAQERAINNITTNIHEFHRDYKTGGILFMAGAGVAGASALFQVADPDGGGEDLHAGLTIGGGIIALVGGIIMIDAHKWIGDVGALQLKGTSITYRF